MANKYFGKVGYVIPKEEIVDGLGTGVWINEPIERQHYGDILKNFNRFVSGDKVNEDITLSNSISIIADPFAYENCSHIRYIEWMGAKWKVTSVSVEYPRLVLSIGGVYNGE